MLKKNYLNGLKHSCSNNKKSLDNQAKLLTIQYLYFRRVVKKIVLFQNHTCRLEYQIEN